MSDRKRWSNSDSSFYRSKDWRLLREEKINNSPLCELCQSVGLTTPATVVDHIISIEVNSELKLVKENLQSLCDEFNGINNCHRQKTGITKKYKDFNQYLKEMQSGKLQYICTKESKEKLLAYLEQNKGT